MAYKGNRLQWKKKVKSRLSPLLDKNRGYQIATWSYLLISFVLIFVLIRDVAIIIF